MNYVSTRGGIAPVGFADAVMMGLAGSITREKEQGTLDGLLVSPVSRVSIIMGKTESQTVRGLAQGAIILLLSMTIFGRSHPFLRTWRNSAYQRPNEPVRYWGSSRHPNMDTTSEG